MEFNSFDEVWKALGRLYDESVKNHEAMVELRGSIKDLEMVSANVLSAVDKLHTVAESHERRLDRAEITIDAILDELQRRREGRSPQ